MNPPYDAALENSSMFKLAEHFHSLAIGSTQVPSQPLTSHLRDTIADVDVIAYHDQLVADAGPLFSHFLASVPYILEEMARIGVALTRLSNARRTGQAQHFSFFEVDAFDGSNGRALAAHSRGLVQTLTCSPNRTNQIAFDRYASPEHSLFYPQLFFKVTPSLLSSAPYQRFAEGFDYLYETAAFQFYTQDRDLQLSHIKPLLKPGGLAFFLEKLNHADPEEYLRREALKDKRFKTRYFTVEEIEWKRRQMLDQMENGQVRKEALVAALQRHFKHVFLLWNSTNFCELVASDDQNHIEHFLELLGPVNQPGGFCFENASLGKQPQGDAFDA
ncbi:hypothetical protein [Pseudomonas sp. 52 E 6]|uniref:hypothetical protein n=1 Tax=Pseudomonas sp. 52 E 6 TaxID=1844106 RepID=UPI000811D563|nr:hypothetical protein [Pseudomonas sp. 52 E 6]CRM21331.1 hypothetical protein [Pseudomonas sp. 52 E 6]